MANTQKQVKPIIVNLGWSKGLQQNNAENDMNALSDVKNMEFKNAQIVRRKGSVFVAPKGFLRKYLFMKEMIVSSVNVLFCVTVENRLVAYMSKHPEIEFTVKRSDNNMAIDFLLNIMTGSRDNTAPSGIYNHIENEVSHFIVSGEGKILEIRKRGIFKYDKDEETRTGNLYLDMRDGTNYSPEENINWAKVSNRTKPIIGDIHAARINERGVIGELTENPIAVLDKEQAIFSSCNLFIPKKYKDVTDRVGIASTNLMIKYVKDSVYATEDYSGLEAPTGYVGGKPGSHATGGTSLSEFGVLPVGDEVQSVGGSDITFLREPTVGDFTKTGIRVLILKANNKKMYATVLTSGYNGSTPAVQSFATVLMAGSYYCTEPELSKSINGKVDTTGTILFNLESVLGSDAPVSINGEMEQPVVTDPMALIKVTGAPLLWDFPTKIKTGTDDYLSVVSGFTSDGYVCEVEAPLLENSFGYAPSIEFRDADGIFILAQVIEVIVPVGNLVSVGGFPKWYSTNPALVLAYDNLKSLSGDFVYLRDKGFNVWESLGIGTITPVYVNADSQALDIVKTGGLEPLLQADCVVSYNDFRDNNKKPIAIINKTDNKILGVSQKYWATVEVPEYTSNVNSVRYMPVVSPVLQAYAIPYGDLNVKSINAGMKITSIAQSSEMAVIATQTGVYSTDALFRINGEIYGIQGTVQMLFAINKYIVAVTGSKIYVIDKDRKVSTIRNISIPVSHTAAFSGHVVVTDAEVLYIFPEFTEGQVIVRVQNIKEPINEVIFDGNAKCAGFFDRVYVSSQNNIFEFKDGKWTRHTVTEGWDIVNLASFDGELVCAMINYNLTTDSDLYPSGEFGEI